SKCFRRRSYFIIIIIGSIGAEPVLSAPRKQLAAPRVIQRAEKDEQISTSNRTETPQISKNCNISERDETAKNFKNRYNNSERDETVKNIKNCNNSDDAIIDGIMKMMRIFIGRISDDNPKKALIFDLMNIIETLNQEF